MIRSALGDIQGAEAIGEHAEFAFADGTTEHGAAGDLFVDFEVPAESSGFMGIAAGPKCTLGLRAKDGAAVGAMPGGEAAPGAPFAVFSERFCGQRESSDGDRCGQKPFEPNDHVYRVRLSCLATGRW